MHKYYVSSADQITPSTLLLTLEKDQNETRIFSFQPGQYAAISYKRRGQPSVARCFSIVSSPTEQHMLQFSMRTRGKYTTALTKLKPGDEVAVRGPFGGFIFDAERDKKAVFVAGGIGITPFMSMMQFATKLQVQSDITLLYGVASQDDIPFYDKLTEMEQANPRLKIVYVVGNGPTDKLSHKTVATGFINEDVLNLHADAYHEATYFICGPPPFMNGVLKVLNAKQVPSYRLITEAFAQGSHRQTGKVLSWPQNMYVMSGMGLALGAAAIMVTDIVKSLPQTAFVQGDGAIDLLSGESEREQDLDDLINELPGLTEKKGNSKALARALRQAQQSSGSTSSGSSTTYNYVSGGSSAASSGSTGSSSGGSAGGSTSSGGGTTAPTTPTAPTQPVCTTSQSGVTTCN